MTTINNYATMMSRVPTVNNAIEDITLKYDDLLKNTMTTIRTHKANLEIADIQLNPLIFGMVNPIHKSGLIDTDRIKDVYTKYLSICKIAHERIDMLHNIITTPSGIKFMEQISDIESGLYRIGKKEDLEELISNTIGNINETKARFYAEKEIITEQLQKVDEMVTECRKLSATGVAEIHILEHQYNQLALTTGMNRLEAMSTERTKQLEHKLQLKIGILRDDIKISFDAYSTEIQVIKDKQFQLETNYDNCIDGISRVQSRLGTIDSDMFSLREEYLSISYDNSNNNNDDDFSLGGFVKDCINGATDIYNSFKKIWPF